MIHHDIVTMYSAKLIEYSIAIGFLVSFMLFWRFLNGGKQAPVVAHAHASSRLREMVEGFLVPENFWFHPGHAWAKADGSDLVHIGMDDFAHRLVGRVEAITLPKVGTKIGQGETAWSLVSDSISVPMLSPVDGVVVEINPKANQPDALKSDPYGNGWLLKVKASRMAANAKQLVSGVAARRWMEETSQTLRSRLSPDLGAVYQDGGVPVQGLAQSIDPEKWPEIARKFFLT